MGPRTADYRDKSANRTHAKPRFGKSEIETDADPQCTTATTPTTTPTIGRVAEYD
jgi:hypothetical protein